MRKSLSEYLGAKVVNAPWEYADDWKDWWEVDTDDWGIEDDTAGEPAKEYDGDDPEEEEEEVEEDCGFAGEGVLEMSRSYSDFYGDGDEEAESWDVDIRFIFLVDREERIVDWRTETQVYSFGDSGLGDVDGEDCWDGQCEQEAMALFESLVTPREA